MFDRQQVTQVKAEDKGESLVSVSLFNNAHINTVKNGLALNSMHVCV